MSTFTYRQYPAEPIDVLLVEDSPHDVRLLQEAFEMTAMDPETRLHTATTGGDAVSFLQRANEDQSFQRPDLVLLDLYLPDCDGDDVLETITGELEFRRLPVIVLTDSDASDDIARCYEARANAYVTKPPDLDGFVSLVESVERFWFTTAQLPPSSM